MMSSNVRLAAKSAPTPTTSHFLNGPRVYDASAHESRSVVDAQPATSVSAAAIAASASARTAGVGMAGVRMAMVPPRLAIAECRLALLDERAHAFLLVIERERRVELAALEQKAFGE